MGFVVGWAGLVVEWVVGGYSLWLGGWDLVELDRFCGWVSGVCCWVSGACGSVCGVSGGKDGRGNWLECGDCEIVVGMEQIGDHIWQEEEFLEESLGIGGESQRDAIPMQNQTLPTSGRVPITGCTMLSPG